MHIPDDANFHSYYHFKYGITNQKAYIYFHTEKIEFSKENRALKLTSIDSIIPEEVVEAYKEKICV
jgi:hypothetical protein